MIRFIILALALTSFSAFAQVSADPQRSTAGFKNRFTLVKNAEGKVTHIKLNRATRYFTIKPFIDQLKSDLKIEQRKLQNASESEIDDLLIDIGANPYGLNLGQGLEEANALKNSILNVKHIDIDAAFAIVMSHGDFWNEFQRRLNDAMQFLDPSIVANLEDPRFFYKKAVTHKVVVWALNEARKRFTNVPILNIVSFVVVRVHDMMLEQRHFAQNMLLHYFETVNETQLGMTKEEVDRSVSSIFEYRIEATNIFESNRANADWLNYGMNNFYTIVRAGNNTIRAWSVPSTLNSFTDVKKLNFGFGIVTHNGVRKIYHLGHRAHMFSRQPSLAFDFSKPQKVKRLRSLLNLGGVALGFLKLPSFITSNAHRFINSIYVGQVRTEGALVGHFESTGNNPMVNAIYSQRSNLYIVP